MNGTVRLIRVAQRALWRLWGEQKFVTSQCFPDGWLSPRSVKLMPLYRVFCKGEDITGDGAFLWRRFLQYLTGTSAHNLSDQLSIHSLHLTLSGLLSMTSSSRIHYYKVYCVLGNFNRSRFQVFEIKVRCSWWLNSCFHATNIIQILWLSSKRRQSKVS